MQLLSECDSLTVSVLACHAADPGSVTQHYPVIAGLTFNITYVMIIGPNKTIKPHEIWVGGGLWEESLFH